MLSENEKVRYGRHFILSGFNEEAQEKIKNAKVLIVGAGGLGSPVSYYLAAAGVGLLGIIDLDVVSESNLQRQILYNSEEIGISKAEIAAKKLMSLNPFVDIKTYPFKLDSLNAREIISQYDIVADGTDNFEARYLISDTCESLGKPYVYGSINEYSGQASVFCYKGGPTYRSLYPEAPPQEEPVREIGVMGPLPGVIGSIEANETLKIITGLGDVLSGRLLLYDSLIMKFTELRI